MLGIYSSGMPPNNQTVNMRYVFNSSIPCNILKIVKITHIGCAWTILGSLPYSQVKKLKQDCRAGDTSACADIGSLLLSGDSVKQDATKASRFFQTACIEGENNHGCSHYDNMCNNLGEGRACTNLGLMHMRGDGVAEDHQKSHGLISRGCDMGHCHGCFVLVNCVN